MNNNNQLTIDAYPIIYSRTKLVDYLPGFLARPKDLNADKAAVYVTKALDSLHLSGGIRHAVFPVDDYWIYGGVACAPLPLVEKISNECKKERKPFNLDYSSYEKYLKDKSGRVMYFFIGFAVKHDELYKGLNNLHQIMVPNIDLDDTYKIYLEKLEPQWESVTTSTDFSDSPIPLKLVSFDENDVENFEKNELEYHGKRFLRYYNDTDYKKYIQYYFAKMTGLLKHQKQSEKTCSFLSNVLLNNITEDYPFTYMSFYEYSNNGEEGLSKLKDKYRNIPDNTEVNSFWDYIRKQENACQENACEEQKKTGTTKKKTQNYPVVCLTIVMILILLIVLLLLRGKISTPKKTLDQISSTGSITDKTVVQDPQR